MRESLWQFLFAGNFGLSPSISSQLTLLQPKIAKESLKINSFRVQGHSRSSMLTFPRSSLSVLVMISSMVVPICNHLHTRQANRRPITRESKLSYGESQKSLSNLGSDQYWVVTDTKTELP